MTQNETLIKKYGGLTLEDVSATMQAFKPSDYFVFVAMLVSCCGIGIYYSLRKRSFGEAEYLVGGRNMSSIPVSVSLVASFLSGISLLGIPTEMYVYGTSFLFILLSFIPTGFIMTYIYLPVFHEMRLTSTYEYLERRFDKRMRIFGSVLFSLNIIIWLPMVIYVAALAFSHVTGISFHIVTPFVCLICIFYTCVGGIRAVVWTDFLQAFIMVGTMLIIAIKGTTTIGGISSVIEKNKLSGRLEAPTVELSFFIRHTAWSLLIGAMFHNLHLSSTSQDMVQRFLSLPNLKAVRRVAWLYIFGLIVFCLICGYTGLLVYAWFHDCDPLTTKLAKQKDQLLPLLVMDVLGDIPCLPGLFISAIFSAALSSLSTGLNSMAAVVLEDFVKPFRKKSFSAVSAERLMKLIVVLVGCLSTGLVFAVAKAGSHVLQLYMSVISLTSGPSLAIFTMGVLIPRINAKAALIGGTSGLCFMTWLCMSAELAVTSGEISFPEKPVSTEGCTYSYPRSDDFSTVSPRKESESWAIYRISYLWYTATGALTSIIVSLCASFFTHTEVEKKDPALFAPCIRKYIRRDNMKPYKIQEEKNHCADSLIGNKRKADETTLC